ncbi:MAG TPA: hypothetical protein VLG69_01305 [Candidatus Andersenbacteria bacterium]|nr:hypothetical protein [Candidatus Andersenbacteria bacterium]
MTNEESPSKSPAFQIVTFLNVAIFIYLNSGHPLKIVKPKQADIERLFEDIKMVGMRIEGI